MSKEVSRKYFFIMLFMFGIVGFIVRFWNINFASLWGDELYSMLSVYPGNSWYKILYMQRTYQPPGYFMLLWGWTKVVGFDAFSARLLSVLGGVLAIVLTGFLGKKVKNERLGLLLAFFVTFNPTQIMYSLEARFYIFAYCLAVMSLWLHWHLLIKRSKNFFLYFILAGINAALCYFHHFGIFFVFALFVHDVFVFANDKDKPYFIKKILVYVLAAVFYSPWFFWGLLQGMAVTQFWLDKIDVWSYFIFSMGYPLLMNLVITALILGFLVLLRKKENKYFEIFPFIVGTVITVPLIYSVIKFPILVDRYGMVMAPAMYLIVGIALLWVINKIKNNALKGFCIAFMCTVLAVPGISMSFINKKPLTKQPWREMAQFLKQQQDYKTTNIYAIGTDLNNRFTIDFYTLPDTKAKQIYNLKPGEDNKMYLVETSSVWKIKQPVLDKVYDLYNVQVIPFQTNYPDFGNVYICTRKN